MTKFRSTLIVAVTAFVAAACGDKVTVAGPVTPTPVTPKVNSVSVAPASATMNIGDKITLTAAVNADAGLATTVTWSSSDASKASVAGGVVTAVAATPGVAICATSTVDTGKLGCASVIVTAGVAPVGASVSIASITTQAGGLNQPVPVPPATVAGQINVTINVTPGTVKLDSIVATVDGKSAGKQGFSATQAAALRSAADEAIAAQATVPTIIISINTADFDAKTGAAKYLNGSRVIGAVAYGKQGTTATTASAGSGITLALGNTDAVLASVTPVGTFKTANSVLGFQWTKIPDSLDVQFTYVGYSGRAVSTMSVRPVCGDSAWTKVASPFKVRYGVPATGYQTTNNAGGCGAAVEANGEAPVLVSAVMTDGNAAPVGLALDANNVIAIAKRFDNLGPSVPVITTTVGIAGIKTRRAAGWMNDAVKLTSVIGSTEGTASTSASFSGSLISTRGTEAGGVSAGAASTDAAVVTYQAFIAADIATATATTATAVSSTAGIAETAGQTMCLVVRSADALGNLSPAPTSCIYSAGLSQTSAQIIGIDRTAPAYARYPTVDTLVPGSGTGYRRLPTDSILDLTTTNSTGRLVVFAADTATGLTTGRSGMLGVRYLINRQSNGNAAVCVYGTVLAAPNTCTTGTDGFVTAVLGQGATAATDDFATAALNASQGYYTISATAYDAAGNATVVGARNGYYDTTAPSTVGVSVTTAATVIAPGVYTVDNQDNIDLGYTLLAQRYTNGTTTLNWRCSRTDLKTTFGPTFVIGDTRGLSTCTTPAGVMLTTTATGELADTATVGYLPSTTGGLYSLTSDFVGNTTALTSVASSNSLSSALPTAAGIYAAVGATAGTNARCGAVATFPTSGFCNIVVTSDAASLYMGGGTLAANTAVLTATVVSVDSVLIPTTATVFPLPDSTVAVRKAAALATATSRSLSPFVSVTLLVGDGQTDLPIATTAGTPSSVIDSTTTNTYYVVKTTTAYIATFTPSTIVGFGAISPIAKKAAWTVGGTSVNARAVARYRALSAAGTVNTNVGVAALYAVTNANNSTTNKINVLSPALSLSIKK